MQLCTLILAVSWAISTVSVTLTTVSVAPNRISCCPTSSAQSSRSTPSAIVVSLSFRGTELHSGRETPPLSTPFKAGVIRPTVRPGRFRQSAGQYSSGQLCRRRRNRVNSTYRPVRHRLPWWVCQPTLVAVPPSVRLRPLHVYAATDLPSPDPHPVVDGHPPPSA